MKSGTRQRTVECAQGTTRVAIRRTSKLPLGRILSNWGAGEGGVRRGKREDRHLQRRLQLDAVERLLLLEQPEHHFLCGHKC